MKANSTSMTARHLIASRPSILGMMSITSATTRLVANFEALPDMLTAKDLEALLQIDRKTIYAYVQKGLIPHSRIESNVRFSKHQVQRWLEDCSFQARSVNGKGAKRQ